MVWALSIPHLLHSSWRTRLGSHFVMTPTHLGGCLQIQPFPQTPPPHFSLSLTLALWLQLMDLCFFPEPEEKQIYWYMF